MQKGVLMTETDVEFLVLLSLFTEEEKQNIVAELNVILDGPSLAE